jgi:hypothetical protein
MSFVPYDSKFSRTTQIERLYSFDYTTQIWLQDTKYVFYVSKYPFIVNSM